MKQIDETKKTAADEPLPDAAETPEAETPLPESALDAVSGGFIERDTGADAKAHDSPSDKPHSGFFKPLD